MNERIRQLIEQATIRGEEYLPGNDGHPTPTVYFDKEKFAELIVKECAQVAKLTEADDGDDYKSGRQWAGIDVLKHFGVEE